MKDMPIRSLLEKIKKVNDLVPKVNFLFLENATPIYLTVTALFSLRKSKKKLTNSRKP